MIGINDTYEITTPFIVGVSDSDSNILGHTGDRLPLRKGRFYKVIRIVDYEELELELSGKRTTCFIKSNKALRFRHPYKNELKKVT